jgi:hypothetical protein
VAYECGVSEGGQRSECASFLEMIELFNRIYRYIILYQE